MMSAVEWSSLRTALGDASHVPATLVDLLGEDEGARKAAYWRLDNHVVLQGDLYEAAPFVALHLIRALREGVESARRPLVYRLLYEIHNGYADDSRTVKLGPVISTLRDACRQIVSEDPRLFSHDAISLDPQLRKEAIDLLVSFEEKIDEVRQILSAAADTSTDSAAESDLRRALREVNGNS